MSENHAIIMEFAQRSCIVIGTLHAALHVYPDDIHLHTSGEPNGAVPTVWAPSTPVVTG